MWTLTDIHSFFSDSWNHILQGVIYGSISAILVNAIRPKPKIYICKEIAKIEDKNTQEKRYRIKIINWGFFSAYHIDGFFRFYDVKSASYFVVKFPTLPVLHGYRILKKDRCEYVTTISPLMISEDKINKLDENSPIRKKYHNSTLSVEDFSIENDTNVELILSATHSKSGQSKAFERKFKKIVWGEWEEGYCKIHKVKRSKVSEGN